jgi:hypothetical protein
MEWPPVIFISIIKSAFLKGFGTIVYGTSAASGFAGWFAGKSASTGSLAHPHINKMRMNTARHPNLDNRLDVMETPVYLW